MVCCYQEIGVDGGGCDGANVNRVACRIYNIQCNASNVYKIYLFFSILYIEWYGGAVKLRRFHYIHLDLYVSKK